jgi:transposase
MDTIVVDGMTAGSRRRRFYSLEEKQQLVAESYEPGASVSLVARRHDMNANLLFTWRRQMRELTPTAPPLELIEIVLAGGVRVRVDAGVSEAALKRVLAAVKAAA